MVSFQIDGKGYHSPNWKDVPLSKFIAFLEQTKAQQPEFMDDFLIFEEGEEIELEKRWNELEKDQRIEALEYFSIEIAFWCNAPRDIVIKNITPEDALAGWVALQYQYNPNTFEVDEDFKKFKFKRTTYVLPDKHLRGTTIGEYADAANFQTLAEQLKNGRWTSIADVMAVICRPEGQAYNFEKHHANRAKLFMSLPMDIVINVAFFLHRQNVTSTDTLAIYFLQQAKDRLNHKLTT